MSGPRLDDAGLRRVLGELDDLLDRVDRLPGPSRAMAHEAVEMLAEIYGEALARVVGLARAAPDLTGALAADELLSHLLVLHGLHPDGVEARVAGAVDGARRVLAASGMDVELTGVVDGTASVRLSGAGGCGGSAADARRAVEEAVLAAAPELAGVEVVAATPAEVASVPVAVPVPVAPVPVAAVPVPVAPPVRRRAPPGAARGPAPRGVPQ